MDEVVQNLVAKPASAGIAGVVVKRPAVGGNALHDVPDVVVLADDIVAVGGDAKRSPSVQMRDAGVVSVVNVVVL